MLNPKINQEYVAWEMVHGCCVGIKFVTVIAINRLYIYGFWRDKYGGHDAKFSRRTGKEFRKNCHLRLSAQKVLRK